MSSIETNPLGHAITEMVRDQPDIYAASAQWWQYAPLRKTPTAESEDQFRREDEAFRISEHAESLKTAFCGNQDFATAIEATLRSVADDPERYAEHTGVDSFAAEVTAQSLGLVSDYGPKDVLREAINLVDPFMSDAGQIIFPWKARTHTIGVPTVQVELEDGPANVIAAPAEDMLVFFGSKEISDRLDGESEGSSMLWRPKNDKRSILTRGHPMLMAVVDTDREYLWPPDIARGVEVASDSLPEITQLIEQTDNGILTSDAIPENLVNTFAMNGLTLYAARHAEGIDAFWPAIM